MIIERIDRSNKAAFFWGWCGFWSLAAGIFALVRETIAMSRVATALPLDRREYIGIVGFAGILAGAINGVWSGSAILLGLWLKTQLRKRESISRHSTASPMRRSVFRRKAR